MVEDLKGAMLTKNVKTTNAMRAMLARNIGKAATIIGP